MDREEEITRRIEQLKRKNEQLMQRYQEVEADRKSAEKSGQSFNSKGPDGSARGHERAGGARHPHARAHMDDDQDYGDRENRRTPRSSLSRGRGTGTPNSGRGSMNPGHRTVSPGRGSVTPGRGYVTPGQRNTSPGRGPVNPGQRNISPGQGPPNRGRGAPRGRGRGDGRFQDYTAKRRENFRLMEEEIAQSPAENEDPGTSRFLDDPRRRGELEPEDRWKSTRHKGSYGGLEFDNVKRGVRGRGRGNRQPRGRARGMSRLQNSVEYTGRERQDQERWQAMREAADKEIMSRSKTSEGQWRRAWDVEKGDEYASQRRQDPGRSEQYDEPRRNYRGGGRGRRGSGGGRRGSRSTHESGENGKENQKETRHHEEPLIPAENGKEKQKEITHDEESTKPVADAERKDSDACVDAEDRREQEEPHKDGSRLEKKPDKKLKKKQSKSPRHLVQHRAQTPSSKDGTEVWAQNSHHSDETGAEWKNGANRSMEQWLPSNEGNRNPAIDERMLEQQEDGATVYSQHLGRGWGSEKNIKATKAWVIDTEKAGATKRRPSSDNGESNNTKENNDDRSFERMHMGRRNRNSEMEDARIKEIMSERAGMRSASPRLKRDNPGLTVEIRKGGDRRVKRYSEGDSVRSPDKVESIRKSDPALLEKDDKESSPPVTSPLSAEFLKTPEGLKHVDDWATEMDLQSPTYELRQRELEKAMKHQTEIKTENKGPDVPEPSKTVELDTNASGVARDTMGETLKTDNMKDNQMTVVPVADNQKATNSDDQLPVPDTELHKADSSLESGGSTVKGERSPQNSSILSNEINDERKTENPICVVSDNPLPVAGNEPHKADFSPKSQGETVEGERPSQNPFILSNETNDERKTENPTRVVSDDPLPVPDTELHKSDSSPESVEKTEGEGSPQNLFISNEKGNTASQDMADTSNTGTAEESGATDNPNPIVSHDQSVHDIEHHEADPSPESKGETVVEGERSAQNPSSSMDDERNTASQDLADTNNKDTEEQSGATDNLNPIVSGDQLSVPDTEHREVDPSPESMGETLVDAERSAQNPSSSMDDERNTASQDLADTNFKDAEEEIEDEFYECDGTATEQSEDKDQQEDESSINARNVEAPVEESETPKCQEGIQSEDTDVQTATLETETIPQVELKETVQQESLPMETESTQQPPRDNSERNDTITNIGASVPDTDMTATNEA